MNVPHEEKNDPRSPSRGRRPVWFAAATLVVAIALFLLGCFVVGPSLSRHRSSPRPTAMPTESRDEIVVSTHPEPVRTEEKPSVKIAIREQPRRTSSVTKTPQILASDEPSIPAPPATTVPSVPEEPVETSPQPEDGPIYRVQAGTFADKANADGLAKQITERGFQAYVRQVQRDDKTLYCVQAGVFRTRDAAAQVANALDQSDIDAVVTVADP